MNRIQELKNNDPFKVMTNQNHVDKPWWKIAKCYFSEHYFTEHQLNSYNTFMREKLPNIITNNEFEYSKDGENYIVTFDNVYIKKPEFTEPSGVTDKLYPQTCRIRNLTYTCPVYTDIIRYTVGEDSKILETKTFPDVFIGAMPCMIRSEFCHLHNKDDRGMIKNEECPLDPGGYFIINGSEKVLMSQDRMGHNEIFVFKAKEKDNIKLPLKDTEKHKSMPCSWYAEVRSHSEYQEPNITTTLVKLSKEQLDKGEDPRLYVEVPGLKNPVPWPILFMALGVCDTSEMVDYVCDKDDSHIIALLAPSLECPEIKDQEQAVKYLANYVQNTQKDIRELQIKKILREKLFQNITQTHMKRFYLGYMTYLVLATSIGRRPEDDRDHYGKKRVEGAGSLLNNLFKSIWKRVLRETKNHLEKKRTNDLAQIMYSKFTNYIKPPFATGNWTATKLGNNSCKVGISQLLNRHNYISTLSNLRRVITPNDKNSKIIKPRHLHNSQWMFICPSETPEGQSTGLVKNLAMLTTISLGSDDDVVINWLELKPNLVKTIYNMPETTPKDIQKLVKIFVNGSWVGVTESPEELLKELRQTRRDGKISFEVSISLIKSGIRIYTDEGRLLAPFLVVQDGQLVDLPSGDFSWQELVDTGVVEYLDPAELETLYHSEYPWKLELEHTHSVIHPSFQFGVAASTAPFATHNQSPRVIYQSSMCKQALGVFGKNFLHRYDTNAHILCYPQKPLVNTKTMELLGMDELPSGQNLIVAINCAAYNQEDSVIINKRSIDNGALRSFCYTTYDESYHRKGNTIDEIVKPEKMVVKEARLKGYAKLDADGVSKENIPLAKRDVVIGKVNTTPSMVRDTSVIVKSNGMTEDSIVEVSGDNPSVQKYIVNNIGSAIVDRSVVTINEDSFKTIKVRTRQLRIPQIGDKVASRSAQKGICGLIVEPENMPFSKKTGISPDLIMNPNAIPSRMTIAQTLECLLGKVCSLRGTYGDCTPCEQDFSEETIEEELKKYGFEQCGNEIMINGETGEEMECPLFMGPTYYQRLKHMVDDKIHCLSPDHDVLTSKGWKPIGDITSNDLVATLQDGNLVYANPVNIWKYSHVGNMYSIQSDQVDLLTTMEHKMWVCMPDNNQYNFYKASDIIGKHVKYQKNANWESSFNFPLKGDTNSWLTVIGIFYTKGWINNNHIVISYNKHIIEKTLINALDILELDYINDPESKCIYINNIDFVNILCLDNIKETLPYWVWNLHSVEARQLLSNICINSKNTNNVNFYTYSNTLMDDIQRLALHSGWSSNSYFISKLNMWKLDIIKIHNNPVVNDKVKKHDNIIDYKGDVHCLEVPGNTFYVRRNGKTVWTGNSRDQNGPRETLTRQPVEGRKRGGGFRMGEMETWCGISHGASMFLIDRLVNNSDGYEQYVCDFCGTTAIATLKTNRFECKHCQQNTNISKIKIPYAFKLLCQELQGTCQGIWYNVDTTETVLPTTT